MNLPKIISHKVYSALETEKQSLITKLQDTENEVLTLKEMSKTMTEQVAGHNQVIADLKASHESAIATLKAEYDKSISDLKVQVQVEADSSESKAISTLAKIGVPEDKLPKATENTMTPEYVIERMKSDKSFFEKNKETILKMASATLAANK